MTGHYFVAFELPEASPEDMARLDARLGEVGSASFAGIGFVMFEYAESPSELDAAESAFEEYIAACRELNLTPCPLEMVVEQ